MKWIHLSSWNVIYQVKFGIFWTFDRRPPFIYSSAGLFLMSSSMPIPNLAQIEWKGSKCQVKMWFVGSNLVDFVPLIKGRHLEFWENTKILPYACFYGLVAYTGHFCPNLTNQIHLPSGNVISLLPRLYSRIEISPVLRVHKQQNARWFPLFARFFYFSREIS